MTKEELDTLSDKIELAVMRGMDQHLEKCHIPMQEQINGINRKIWTAGGFFTAAWSIFSYLLMKR